MARRETALDVGVDLDGVCYDFIDALANWAAETTGRPRSEFGPAQHWAFYEDWGWTEDEFLSAYGEALQHGDLFKSGPIFAEAAVGLERLAVAGHRIHVITDRGLSGSVEEARRQTVAWLRNHKVRYASLHVGSDKTVVPVDIAIEDSERHYRALESAGRNPRLLTRPWNAHMADARRVVDWAAFVAEVEAATEQLSLAAAAS